MKVNLYSTLGCHLCEQAKLILLPLITQYQFHLTEVEIAEDDNLISQYGIRIPVLGSPSIERELNWPFSAREANIFFAELAGI